MNTPHAIPNATVHSLRAYLPRWLGGQPRSAAALQPATRREQAEALRAYAQRFAQSERAFADELFDAAWRHELAA